MLVLSLLSSAFAVTGFHLDSVGMPLVRANQVVECPNEAGEGVYQTSYRSTGKKQLKGTCRDGLYEDGWKAWHDNGVMKWKTDMVGGRMEGRFKSWHEDGYLRAKGDFSAGLADGTWKYWHEGGVRAGKGSWDLGQKQGCWATWDRDGDKSSKGAYVDGDKVGRWLYWDQGVRRKERYGGSTSSGRCWWPLI